MIHGADHRTPVGMGQERTAHGLIQQATVGGVIVALSSFFFDHFTLGFDPLILDLGMEHPFAFHPETQFQLIGWQNFKIKGPIVKGVGVEDPSIGFNQFHVLTATNILASLKKEMLEEMSKTRPLRVFVFAANFVRNRHSHNGGGGILVQENFESVGQGVSLKGNHLGLGLATR